jgi:hypothetical protein
VSHGTTPRPRPALYLDYLAPGPLWALRFRTIKRAHQPLKTAFRPSGPPSTPSRADSVPNKPLLPTYPGLSATPPPPATPPWPPVEPHRSKNAENHVLFPSSYVFSRNNARETLPSLYNPPAGVTSLMDQKIARRPSATYVRPDFLKRPLNCPEP